MIDQVLKSEVTAHVREAQANDRQKQWESDFAKFRAHVRDPKNREKYLALTREMIASSIRNRPGAWTDEEVREVSARDAGIAAYLNGAAQVRDIGPSAVHVNQLMGEMSVKYVNRSYIGELIAEPLTVSKESNIFAFYDERDSLQVPNNVVSNRGIVNQVNQQIDKSSHTYQVIPYGLMEYVTPREIANADVPLDPLLDAQLHIMEQNALAREKKAAAFFLASANYSADRITAVNAGEEYDSANGGNPGKQIHDAVKSILVSNGVSKVMAMSLDTFLALARHPALLYTSVYTKGGFLTVEMMRQLFMVDELYISEAWQDTANSGQTRSISRLWGDFICVVGMMKGAAQSLRSYQFAKRFRCGPVRNETLFNPYEGMAGVYQVKETYLEDLQSVAPLAGALITNALS